MSTPVIDYIVTKFPWWHSTQNVIFNRENILRGGPRTYKAVLIESLLAVRNIIINKHFSSTHVVYFLWPNAFFKWLPNLQQ